MLSTGSITDGRRTGVVSHVDIEAVEAYVTSARWFGGKARRASVAGVRRIGRVGTGTSPVVVIDLVEVNYDESPPGSLEGTGSTEVELYQVPLALYPTDQEQLEDALVGHWEDPEFGPVVAYDGVHDQEAVAAWLAAFDRELPTDALESADQDRGDLSFHRTGCHDLGAARRPTLFSGEQSNSSVMLGNGALLKVFRKVTPGVNPDIAVHDVLTRAGSEHVAPLFGWVSSDDLDLAMLQAFLPDAADGWDLARASVRRLLAAEARADSSEASFTADAASLGAALAQVHVTLAAEFPTVQRGTAQMRALGDAMNRRLDQALRVAPSLSIHEQALRVAYDAVAHHPGDVAQRIHGDLHLGQTLRTEGGWKIVDFEGEPAKPLAERALPDSPWRDVAGMLRSFDYAARSAAMTPADLGDAAHDRRGSRAEEWSIHHRAAFLGAYTSEHPASDADRSLMVAYAADKAVYETVYETRNRPDWVTIPLAAIGRELGTGGPA